MSADAMLNGGKAPMARTEPGELKERMAALSERIVALAEAANIVAEAAAPIKARAIAVGDGSAASLPDGFTALERAAARLEAARLAAVDEFVALKEALDGEPAVH